MKFPKLSKQKTHQRWTDIDRDKLREFAQTGISDRMIARVMGRTEGAVKWQRRELRIRKAKLKSRGYGGRLAQRRRMGRIFWYGERTRGYLWRRMFHRQGMTENLVRR